MAITGLLQVGIELGLDALLVRPRRGIADLPLPHATIEEVHHDELEITQQPVEFGAMITDHAFKRPAEVTIKVGYSNSPGSAGLIGSVISAVTGTIAGVASLLNGNSESPIAAIYARFLQLQADREPCDVYTGKRVYKDMLVRGLATTTDKEHENSMELVVHMQQIIIVPTATVQTVTADPVDQSNPEDTNPPSDEGTRQPSDASQYNDGAGDASIGGFA